MRRAGAGIVLICLLSAHAAAAADDARIETLRTEIAEMPETRIEALFTDLFRASGCELSMVDEEATDRRIMSHFGAVLGLSVDEAEVLHDDLQDRIQPVSLSMVKGGLIDPDIQAGVVRLKDCTPDIAGHTVPGVGVVTDAQLADLVRTHFTQSGCTVDFSDQMAAQGDIVVSVLDGLGVADQAAARAPVDVALAGVFETLVTSGELTVDEADMTVSLSDCSG